VAKSLGIAPKSSPLAAAFAKISLRERALIIGLLIVAALIAIVYFAVLPTMSLLTDLTEEVDELTIQQQEMDSVIAQTALYRDNYELSKKDYNTYQEFFFPYMTPEDLDRMVTTMLVDAGFDPTRLSMTSLAVETLPLYTQPPLVPQVVPSYVPTILGDDGTNTAGGISGDISAGGTSGGTSGGDDNGLVAGDGDSFGEGGGLIAGDPGLAGDVGSLAVPSQSDSPSEVYVYTVDIGADGSLQTLFSLLTTVYAMQGIEVTNWTFTEPPTVQEGEEASAGTVTLQIKIYVFLGEELE
jgi:uncharacterized membrane protein YgcG